MDYYATLCSQPRERVILDLDRDNFFSADEASLTQVSHKSHESLTSLTQVSHDSHKSHTSLTLTHSLTQVSQVSHKSLTSLTQVSHKPHTSLSSLSNLTLTHFAHLFTPPLFPTHHRAMPPPP